MVLHRAFRARHLRKNGFGGELRHGSITSGVSRETSVKNVLAGSNNQRKKRIQKRAMYESCEDS